MFNNNKYSIAWEILKVQNGNLIFPRNFLCQWVSGIYLLYQEAQSLNKSNSYYIWDSHEKRVYREGKNNYLPGEKTLHILLTHKSEI